MNERPPPDSPQAWIERARSDLALSVAGLEMPDVLLEDACFHTQQCAEKALKALLLHYSVAFPRTHVVELLLDLLKAVNVIVPQDVDEVVVLTQYAVQTRYPGDWNPVTLEEARQAVQIATRILTWAEGQLVV